MKTYIIVLIAVLALFAFLRTADATDYQSRKEELTHQQDIWISALEWCESRGNIKAVNPNDLDNTPSYGPFQFKPSTLEYFGVKYKVFTKGESKKLLMDYLTQRSVIEGMVLDGKNIQWKKQFPDCIRKIGMPPLSTTKSLQATARKL